MANLLAGKTALVTGIANKWSIAYAIAQAFHREGAKLILTYQGERLQKTVEEFGAEWGAAQVLPLDVTVEEDLERAGAACAAQGRLDAVVHSIAYADREDLSREFVATSRRGYLLAQEISAYSLVALARAAAPLMVDGGSIIAMTYYGSVKVVPHYNVMGVAKAALEASVRYLAYDLGPKKIRVNAISAGPVNTLAARGIAGFTQMLKHYEEHAPLKRNIEPRELGTTGLFLASDMSSGMTGQVIYVDSGYEIMGM